MKNSRQCHRQRAAQLNALALKEKRFYRERLKVCVKYHVRRSPKSVQRSNVIFLQNDSFL